MAKRTIFDFASFAVATQWHFTQIILMEKLASGSFHTEVAKPVTTHDGSQPRVVLGAGQDGLGPFAVAKDGTGLAVGERIESFGNTVFQGVILEIILYCVDC
jgi:hypothetical protein